MNRLMEKKTYFINEPFFLTLRLFAPTFNVLTVNADDNGADTFTSHSS